MSQSKRTRAVTMGAMSVVLLGATMAASADVVPYYDRDEWFSDVPGVTTIDFTDLSPNEVVTDQYSDLGVTFTDGNDIIWQHGGFVNDGWGLYSNVLSDIAIEFDTPQRALSFECWGTAGIDLYRGGQLVYSHIFHGAGSGEFAGVVSDESFDAAVIHSDGFAYLDDLHFAAVPSPAPVLLLPLTCLLQRRRRR